MNMFYELIQIALGYRKVLNNTLSDVEWHDLYVMCQKQSMTGVVFGTLEGLSSQGQKPSLELLCQWMGIAGLIKHQNIVLNKEVEALTSLLDRHQIKYAVVKGQVVARYYEKPEYRHSGDIDFYIPEKDARVAKIVIEDEWQVEMERGSSLKHYAFNHNGVMFEMHFHLFEWYNESKNNMWNEILYGVMNHRVKIGDTQVATLDPTIHSLYIFLHLYHHLLELGVGLRQFCDWAMILHACKDEIDHEAIKKHLKVFGMEKAYKACGAILVRDLGLPANEFTYELTDYDMRYADKILDVVFYRGNMGHYNKRGGFHGWKHKLESTGIKLSHFFKFYPLAPSFMRDWVWGVVKSRL